MGLNQSTPLSDSFYIPPNPTAHNPNFQPNASTPESRLLHLLTDALDAPPAPVMALVGMGGSGKTCALRAVAAHPQVRTRFHHAVCYVQLSKSAQVEEMLQQLIEIVRVHYRAATADDLCRMANQSSLQSRTIAKTVLLLKSKSVLLVVDDVWKGAAVYSRFLELLRLVQKHSDALCLVFSTRDWNVANLVPQKAQIHVRPLQPTSAVAAAILFNYAQLNAHDVYACAQDIVTSFEQVLSHCAGLPLTLAIAGCSVRTMLRNEQCNVQNVWKAYLRRITLPGSLLQERSEEDKSMFAAVQLSLDALEECQAAQHGVAAVSVHEVFRCFAITSKSKWCPISVIECALEGSSGEDGEQARKGEVEKVCRSFAQLNLVDIATLHDTLCVTLHDLVHDYCTFTCEPVGLMQKLHKSIVTNYWMRYGSGSAPSKSRQRVLRSWWTCAGANNGYVADNIAVHLAGAGEVDELLALVVDFRWTQARMEFSERGNNLFMLSRDVKILIQAATGNMAESVERGLRLVSEAAELSAPFVAVNGRELAFQMHGRLSGVSKQSGVVKRYLWSLEQHAAVPWIRPYSGMLREAGGAVRLNISLRRQLLCVAVVGSGREVVIGDNAGRVLLVDMRSGSVLHTCWVRDGGVYAIAACGSDGRFVAGCDSGKLSLLRCKQNYGRRALIRDGSLLGHDGAVLSVVANDDGDRVVSSGEDTKIIVWNAADFTKVHVLEGHSAEVCSIALRGSMLVSGSWDCTVRVWDMESGKPVGSAVKRHEYEVSSVSVSEDKQWIAASSYDGRVRVWHVQRIQGVAGRGPDYAVDQDMEIRHPESVMTTTFGETSEKLYFGDREGMTHCWNIMTQSVSGSGVRAHSQDVRGMAVVCNEGEYEIVSVSSDESVSVQQTKRGSGGGGNNGVGDNGGNGRASTRIWDWVSLPDKRGYVQSVRDCGEVWISAMTEAECGMRESRPMLSVDSAARTEEIALAREPSSTSLPNRPAATPQSPTENAPSSPYPQSATALPNTNQPTSPLQLYPSKSTPSAPPLHPQPSRAPEFPPDAPASSQPPTPAPIPPKQAPPSNPVASLRPSPSHTPPQHLPPIPSRRLAVLPEDVTRMAVSWNSQFIVAGTKSGYVFLIDLHTGSVQRHIASHRDNGLVLCIDVSHDNRFIASGSMCGSLRVFDAHSSICVDLPCTEELVYVKSVGFSEHDSQVVAACGDGRVRCWDLEQRVLLHEFSVLCMSRAVPKIPDAIIMRSDKCIALKMINETGHRLYNSVTGTHSVAGKEGQTAIHELLQSTEQKYGRLDKEGCLWMAPFGSSIYYGERQCNVVLGTLESRLVGSFYPSEWVFNAQTKMFARGVWMQDQFIARLVDGTGEGSGTEVPEIPLITGGPVDIDEEWPDVFISHAGEDKIVFAKPLYEKLKRKNKRLRVFLDAESLHAGDKTGAYLMNDALEKCRAAVFVLSREFFRKQWPVHELRTMLRRRAENEREGKPGPAFIVVFYRMTVEECKGQYGGMVEELNWYWEGKGGQVVQCIKEVSKYPGIRNDKGQSGDELGEEVADEVIRALESTYGSEEGLNIGKEGSMTRVEDGRKRKGAERAVGKTLIGKRESEWLGNQRDSVGETGKAAQRNFVDSGAKTLSKQSTRARSGMPDEAKRMMGLTAVDPKRYRLVAWGSGRPSYRGDEPWHPEEPSCPPSPPSPPSPPPPPAYAPLLSFSYSAAMGTGISEFDSLGMPPPAYPATPVSIPQYPLTYELADEHGALSGVSPFRNAYRTVRRGLKTFATRLSKLHRKRKSCHDLAQSAPGSEPRTDCAESADYELANIDAELALPLPPVFGSTAGDENEMWDKSCASSSSSVAVTLVENYSLQTSKKSHFATKLSDLLASHKWEVELSEENM